MDSTAVKGSTEPIKKPLSPEEHVKYSGLQERSDAIMRRNKWYLHDFAWVRTKSKKMYYPVVLRRATPKFHTNQIRNALFQLEQEDPGLLSQKAESVVSVQYLSTMQYRFAPISVVKNENDPEIYSNEFKRWSLWVENYAGMREKRGLARYELLKRCRNNRSRVKAKGTQIATEASFFQLCEESPSIPFGDAERYYLLNTTVEDIVTSGALFRVPEANWKVVEKWTRSKSTNMSHSDVPSAAQDDAENYGGPADNTNNVKLRAAMRAGLTPETRSGRKRHRCDSVESAEIVREKDESPSLTRALVPDLGTKAHRKKQRVAGRAKQGDTKAYSSRSPGTKVATVAKGTRSQQSEKEDEAECSESAATKDAKKSSSRNRTESHESSTTRKKKIDAAMAKSAQAIEVIDDKKRVSSVDDVPVQVSVHEEPTSLPPASSQRKKSNSTRLRTDPDIYVPPHPQDAKEQPPSSTREEEKAGAVDSHNVNSKGDSASRKWRTIRKAATLPDEQPASATISLEVSLSEPTGQKQSASPELVETASSTKSPSLKPVKNRSTRAGRGLASHNSPSLRQATSPSSRPRTPSKSIKASSTTPQSPTLQPTQSLPSLPAKSASKNAKSPSTKARESPPVKASQESEKPSSKSREASQMKKWPETTSQPLPRQEVSNSPHSSQDQHSLRKGSSTTEKKPRNQKSPTHPRRRPPPSSKQERTPKRLHTEPTLPEKVLETEDGVTPPVTVEPFLLPPLLHATVDQISAEVGEIEESVIATSKEIDSHPGDKTDVVPATELAETKEKSPAELFEANDKEASATSIEQTFVDEVILKIEADTRMPVDETVVDDSTKISPDVCEIVQKEETAVELKVSKEGELRAEDAVSDISGTDHHVPIADVSMDDAEAVEETGSPARTGPVEDSTPSLDASATGVDVPIPGELDLNSAKADTDDKVADEGGERKGLRVQCDADTDWDLNDLDSDEESSRSSLVIASSNSSSVPNESLSGNQHFRRKHASSNRQYQMPSMAQVVGPFKCPVCSTLFNKRTSLNSHMKVHSRKNAKIAAGVVEQVEVVPHGISPVILETKEPIAVDDSAEFDDLKELVASRSPGTDGLKDVEYAMPEPKDETSSVKIVYPQRRSGRPHAPTVTERPSRIPPPVELVQPSEEIPAISEPPSTPSIPFLATLSIPKEDSSSETDSEESTSSSDGLITLKREPREAEEHLSARFHRWANLLRQITVPRSTLLSLLAPLPSSFFSTAPNTAEFPKDIGFAAFHTLFTQISPFMAYWISCSAMFALLVSRCVAIRVRSSITTLRAQLAAKIDGKSSKNIARKGEDYAVELCIEYQREEGLSVLTPGMKSIDTRGGESSRSHSDLVVQCTASHHRLLHAADVIRRMDDGPHKFHLQRILMVRSLQIPLAHVEEGPPTEGELRYAWRNLSDTGTVAVAIGVGSVVTSRLGGKADDNYHKRSRLLFFSVDELERRVGTLSQLAVVSQRMREIIKQSMDEGIVTKCWELPEDYYRQLLWDLHKRELKDKVETAIESITDQPQERKTLRRIMEIHNEWYAIHAKLRRLMNVASLEVSL